jgi:hypothetical protein
MKAEYFEACLILDRLQVELCEDTLYPIPSPKETRERILKAMRLLEKLNDNIH